MEETANKLGSFDINYRIIYVTKDEITYLTQESIQEPQQLQLINF